MYITSTISSIIRVIYTIENLAPISVTASPNEIIWMRRIAIKTAFLLKSILSIFFNFKLITSKLLEVIKKVWYNIIISYIVNERNSSMKKINPYVRNVYYYETDKMGIVHHSNYIRILEESRVSFLQQAGMPFEKIEEAGVMIPVLSAECRYLKPLKFGDTFAVYPRITSFNGVKMELTYKIVNKYSGDLCAEGKTSHCFTDYSLKPVRTKLKYPEIYKIFQNYLDYEIAD